MKFEALILSMLCAGSMLVCVLAFGNMLLARPAQIPGGNGLVGTTHCAAPASILPGQVAALDKREHS